jgi:hypothetical protein
MLFSSSALTANIETVGGNTHAVSHAQGDFQLLILQHFLVCK